MSRLSRCRQTLLLLVFGCLTYLALICQVQVLLPVSQQQAQRNEFRFLDYEQRSALQQGDADDGRDQQTGNADDGRDQQTGNARGGVPGEGSAPDHASVHDDMLHEGDRVQTGGLDSISDNHTGSDSGEGGSSHVHSSSSSSSSPPPSSPPSSSPPSSSPPSRSSDGHTQDSRPRGVRFVPVGGMFVYGAFLDLRQKHNVTVRVFVLRHRKDRDSLLCLVSDGKTNHTLYARPYRMCENHGKEYEGWIYSCVLPATVTVLPGHVSLLPSSQRQSRRQATTFALTRIPPQTDPQAARIGVCVPPLFGHLNLASLINFIQMCKVLGADTVFMYMGGVSAEIRTFLTHHSRTDRALSVIDWTLPQNVSERREAVWYHGQLLAIQDCLYHNMATFRFLLFMDLDEMLVPQLAPAWPAMLLGIFARHDQHAVAALAFKSFFFDPTRVPREAERIPYFQHLHRTVSASGLRHKLMVQPMKVFELGIHHLSRGLAEEFRSVEVSEGVARLHHYRACGERQDADVKCDWVTEDRRMLGYKDRLTRLSHRVITDTSRLFA